MKKLSIELENCYGIRKLQTALNFSEQNVYAIYAPNGSMKSSLAQTFRDVADGIPSKDRIFPTRVCERKISDENGSDLPQDGVLVFAPYDEAFGHSEKTSSLLVDAKLRKEYEQLHIDIDNSKGSFLKALKKQSGSKKDLETEISATFTKSEDQFYRALIRVKDEILSQEAAPFADVSYDVIFDDKVLDFLQTKDFKTAIQDYVLRYNKLLEASAYFKKGVFNYYNAGVIAKNLADQGFFSAKHTVNLNAGEKVEIKSRKQLEELILKEKEDVTNDADLKSKFAEIEKLITKNATLREFNAYLGTHEELLPELANVELFREEIWKSYFKAQLVQYEELIAKYTAVEKRKAEIEQEASKQRTQWESVIDIFNERFFVPFRLEAKNRVSVILGQESMLELGFTYEDGPDRAPVEKTALMKALSTGEKKALYVLNIIFEVEARIKANQESLIIFDDIADSFDYKNKYAIIHYLQDISENKHFRLVMLTHNFDFFRTVEDRFVKYSHCLMVEKGAASLSLQKATGIKNVFVNDWKPRFFTDPKKKIASIPFIRNMIEYTKGNKDPEYVRLTSLLHWRADSSGITIEHLDQIYNGMFTPQGASADGIRPVVDVIHEQANACLGAGVGANFENKVVLSIAIRIAAERFMADKINDPAFLTNLVSNQTPKLLAEFRKQFSAEVGALRIIERVVLMTPANIHLNSFMYEPILDMSDEHLRRLYRDVMALN